MNTSRLIKLTAFIAGLVFLTSISVFITKAKESLATELIASTQRIEMFITATHAHRYLQESNDGTPIQNQEIALHEFITASAKQENVNKNFAGYIELVKTDLDAHKIPSQALTNKWLSSFIFQVALDEVKSNYASEANSAPAVMITNPRWSKWIFMIMSSGFLAMFWIGYLVRQNRQNCKK